MVTYLVGTDGESASEAISDHLEREVTADDHVEAVYATNRKEDEVVGAVELIEKRLGSITNVNARVLHPGRGNGPVNALLDVAKDIDADIMVVGLRRHSRTERIIMGSVSHSLIERVSIPIVLVPLPAYQSPEA